MIKYFLIFIFITIPVCILSITCVYHLLKAIPFINNGKVNKEKMKKFLKYLGGTILYSIVSFIVLVLLNSY